MPSGILQFFGAGTALLAGYLFIYFSAYRRYSAERLRADRFALHVVGFALLFFVLGTVVDAYFLTSAEWRGALMPLARNGIPMPVVYAAPLALAGALLDNIVVLTLESDNTALLETFERSIRGRIRLAAIARYVRKSHDSALRVLYRAAFLNKPLMVTLKSGKVYVGEPPSRLDPCEMVMSLRLVPLASGYRDKETKEVRLLTRYTDLTSRIVSHEPVLPARSGALIADDPLKRDLARLQVDVQTQAEIDLEDFGIVILWNEVESLTIFDANIYRAFQNSEVRS